MANRLEALRIFCLAADATNFRDAATRLGVSPQVVTRVVRELEEELGEPLFHRSTRGVQLSSFGEQLRERARAAVEGVDALYQRSDRRAASDLRGVVRLTAPTAIGRQFVLKALAPLLRQHPGLVLDLRLSEVIADVVQDQIDVGLRIGPLRDSRFVGRPVAVAHLAVVATPKLVARVGAPRTLAELQDKPLTALIDRNTGRPWPWMFSAERDFAVSAPAFLSDDPEAEGDAVLAGIGFGQVGTYLVQSHVRAGRLVTVLEADAPPPMTVHVYRSQRSPVPARVRLVYDRLVEAFAQPDGLFAMQSKA